MKTYCKPKHVDIENQKFNLAAVVTAFDGKLNKREFRKLLISTGRITAQELAQERVEQSCNKTLDAIEVINERFTQQIRDRNISFKPVRQFTRIDGISQKEREICQESAEQQIAEYIAVHALMSLFKAKLLPCQHGSIPGHGQTAGKRQLERLLRRKFHCDVDAVKIDETKAYPSVTIGCVMLLLRRDIRKNKPLLWFVGAVMANYPDGHLLIGGYLPTWLFNYVMSYLLRYLMSQHQYRRGVRHNHVWAVVCYADDAVLFGRVSNLRKAIKKTARWARDTMGLRIKNVWQFYYVESFEREKEMHAARKIGCRKRTPGVDMVGYVVRRTYTIIRKKIYKRVRRCFIRALRDLKRLGYIPWWRAVRVMAYNGFVVETDSQNFKKQYQYQKIIKASKQSVSMHGKREAVKREYRILCEAAA